MNKIKMLIVDDEINIIRYVSACLRREGYDVVTASDGQQALLLAEQENPALVILDIKMPKMDGFEVCCRLREWTRAPIIMLSAIGDEKDKVRCLNSGADDYLTKPFGVEELLARIKAVLRRPQVDNMSFQPKYCCGELEVDLANKKASVAGKEVLLTSIEFKILSYLTANAGKVITQNQLLEKVWGEDYIEDKHLLQVHMTRLRHKLQDDAKPPRYIQTRIGIGYELRKMPAR